MNLFQFVFFLGLVALVILSSRVIANILGVPALVMVIPLSSLPSVLLRFFAKTHTRRVWILWSLLAIVALLSMGLGHLVGRDSILTVPIATGLVFLAIQMGLPAWRRLWNSSPSKDN